MAKKDKVKILAIARQIDKAGDALEQLDMDTGDLVEDTWMLAARVRKL